MEQLIQPYRDKVYRFVLRMVDDEMDAEDIMQELAIRIWKRIDAFRKLENPEAWCMTVVRNLAIDKLRNRKKRQYSDVSAAFDISDTGRDPYEQMVAGDVMDLLRKYLDKLPEMQKLTLHLREVEGMSYQEIAETLGQSLEQVKSHIFRGRQTLKKALEQSVLKQMTN